ncbi:MAG: helix-turn-helix domain-containing protein [Balneolaceae bacterium]|nr:helix-turn-helix domain-containing protein [Balneolaceae bacterium]
MQQIKKGDFFGSHNRLIHLDHIVITETVYTHRRVDWHYHENTYFTYLLEGYLGETNKKESYILEPGSLLFHNWQEAHCNEMKSDHSRGFHVEIEKEWFDQYDLDYTIGEGSNMLIHPLIKGTFDRLYLESRISDTATELSITSLMLSLFEKINENNTVNTLPKPTWINRLNNILHDECEKRHSLNSLACQLDVHPAHISRAFPHYFGVTFGEFIRKLRVDKAAALLKCSPKTMTEIAFECGFSDQSHFNRCFKKIYSTTPLRYKKIIAPGINSRC